MFYSILTMIVIVALFLCAWFIKNKPLRIFFSILFIIIPLGISFHNTRLNTLNMSLRQFVQQFGGLHQKLTNDIPMGITIAYIVLIVFTLIYALLKKIIFKKSIDILPILLIGITLFLHICLYIITFD